MVATPFSDTNIANMKPANVSTWYSDSSKRAVPGLRLMVGKRAKTFYLTKRDGDKIRQLRIGGFPEITVELARRHARDLINDVEAGTAQERIDNDARTLCEALEGYIARNVAAGSLSERTAGEYRDVLRLHASDWADMPLDRITTRDVERRFIDMESNPYAGNKLIRVVRQVYKYAMAHDDELRDPTRVIQRLRKEKRRPPKVNDLRIVAAEIATVENPIKQAAWHLLLHTGIRSSNLRNLTWNDVNFDEATVHLERMKNGEARTLPLSDFSLSKFESLRRYDDTFCFPSFRRRGPIDHLDGLPHVRQHDCRHHFTTVAGLCHIPEYVIAFLKGDRVTTGPFQSVAHYMHDLGDHSTVNSISERIVEDSRAEPNISIDQT